MTEPSVRTRAVSGTVWNTAATQGSFVIQFVGSIYLARHINPASFGIVGLSSATLGLVFTITTWGLLTLMVRQSEGVIRFAGTVLSIRALMVIPVSAGALLVVTLLQGVMSSDVYRVLVIILIAMVPDQIFGVVYRAYMQKNMRFGRLACVRLACDSLSVGAACVLAMLGYGLVALVTRSALQHLLNAGLTLAISEQRIPFAWERSYAGTFFRSGFLVFLSNVMDKTFDQSDDVIVGVAAGHRQLGFYQKAFLFCELINLVVYGGVGGVVPSIFGRFRDSPERLKEAYELSSGMVLRASCLLGLWMFFTVPEMVLILYGREWLPVAGFFRLMVPYAVICATRRITLRLHLSAGDYFTALKCQAFELIMFGSGILLFLSGYGANGIALAVDVGSAAGLTALVVTARKIIPIDFRKVFLTPLMVVCASGAVSAFMLQRMPIDNIYARFAAQSLVAIATFVLFTLLSEGRYVMTAARSILSVRKPSSADRRSSS